MEHARFVDLVREGADRVTHRGMLAVLVGLTGPGADGSRVRRRRWPRGRDVQVAVCRTLNQACTTKRLRIGKRRKCCAGLPVTFMGCCSGIRGADGRYGGRSPPRRRASRMGRPAPRRQTAARWRMGPRSPVAAGSVDSRSREAAAAEPSGTARAQWRTHDGRRRRPDLGAPSPGAGAPPGDEPTGGGLLIALTVAGSPRAIHHDRPHRRCSERAERDPHASA
jgi:hypothetical protein